MSAATEVLNTESQFWKIHSRLYENMSTSTGYDPLKSEQQTSYAATTQQPTSQTQVVMDIQPEPEDWKTPLCKGCRPKPLICVCSALCPYCYASSLSKRMKESCLVACCPGGVALLRFKYRMDNNIKGTLLQDVCYTSCALPCVLCQLGNEMDPEKYPKVCCGMY